MLESMSQPQSDSIEGFRTRPSSTCALSFHSPLCAFRPVWRQSGSLFTHIVVSKCEINFGEAWERSQHASPEGYARRCGSQGQQHSCHSPTRHGQGGSLGALLGVAVAAAWSTLLGTAAAAVAWTTRRRQLTPRASQQAQATPSSSTSVEQKEEQQGQLRLVGPEPQRFVVAKGQLKDVASAAFPMLMRLGSGAFVAGYSVGLVPNDGKYAVVEVLGRKLRETSAVERYPRPAQPLTLYEFEGKAGPGSGHASLAHVPTITAAHASSGGPRAALHTPLPSLWSPHAQAAPSAARCARRWPSWTWTSWCCPAPRTAPRGAPRQWPRAASARCAAARRLQRRSSRRCPLCPSLGFWRVPLASLVPHRSLAAPPLTVPLLLAPLGRPCPQPSPSPPALQFPYLVDPNTGTAMYESDAIIDYLFKTYGEGLPPLGLRLGPFTAISCGLAMLPRWVASARGTE